MFGDFNPIPTPTSSADLQCIGGTAQHYDYVCRMDIRPRVAHPTNDRRVNAVYRPVVRAARSVAPLPIP